MGDIISPKDMSDMNLGRRTLRDWRSLADTSIDDHIFLINPLAHCGCVYSLRGSQLCFPRLSRAPYDVPLYPLLSERVYSFALYDRFKNTDHGVLFTYSTY